MCQMRHNASPSSSSGPQPIPPGTHLTNRDTGALPLPLFGFTSVYSVDAMVASGVLPGSEPRRPSSRARLRSTAVKAGGLSAERPAVSAQHLHSGTGAARVACTARVAALYAGQRPDWGTRPADEAASAVCQRGTQQRGPRPPWEVPPQPPLAATSRLLTGSASPQVGPHGGGAARRHAALATTLAPYMCLPKLSSEGRLAGTRRGRGRTV
jgi:hypothetical protein